MDKNPDSELEFSVVNGGGWYRLMKPLPNPQSTLVLMAISWLPLLVFSVVEGRAWGENIKIPFLYDLDMQLRLLIVFPLLLLAELVVHNRLKPIVQEFIKRDLVPQISREKFNLAVVSAFRMRDSYSIEFVIILLVYIIGSQTVWRLPNELTWYGLAVDGKLHRTMAGWWLGWVSLPLFQFILLRWYYRLTIWARFLWQVSRLELNLIPMHPDRCGGLGFLSLTTQVFAVLAFAQGILLTGMMANRIFFSHAELNHFYLEIFALIFVIVLITLGPQLAFTPKLVDLRLNGEREFGTLAQRYVRSFETKWLRGESAENETLLGSSDIQSLADLGNSFQVVQNIRLTPFSLFNVGQLALVTLLPILPLTLTMFSLEEVLSRLVKLVF